MAIVKWTGLGSENSIGGTALNSLVNGSTSAKMVFANSDASTGRNLHARVTVELGSITPSAGGSITIRWYNTRAGVGDEDITAGLDSYTMPLSSGASTKRFIFPNVRIYNGDGGFVLVNNAGVQLAGTGNSFIVQTYNEDVS